MLILYHRFGVRCRGGTQQLLHQEEVFAAHRRNVDHAHRVASSPVKHPPRHFGGPGAAFQVQATPEHGRAAPYQRTANRYRLTEPRMPRIANLMVLGNMGLVSFTCICTRALTCPWGGTPR